MMKIILEKCFLLELIITKLLLIFGIIIVTSCSSDLEGHLSIDEESIVKNAKSYFSSLNTEISFFDLSLETKSTGEIFLPQIGMNIK